MWRGIRYLTLEWTKSTVLNFTMRYPAAVSAKTSCIENNRDTNKKPAHPVFELTQNPFSSRSTPARFYIKCEGFQRGRFFPLSQTWGDPHNIDDQSFFNCEKFDWADTPITSGTHPDSPKDTPLSMALKYWVVSKTADSNLTRGFETVGEAQTLQLPLPPPIETPFQRFAITKKMYIPTYIHTYNKIAQSLFPYKIDPFLCECREDTPTGVRTKDFIFSCI